MLIRKTLAEFFGTFILVFVGSMAILAVEGASRGAAANLVAIGFAFGLALLAGIWALGHISGAHFNPAVTLAMVLDGRTTVTEAIGYWIGQLAGAAVASLVVAAASTRGLVGMTVTGYTIFIWVILASTKTAGRAAPAGIALTLVGVHIAGIPFSGASVNPARSFGPAVVSGEGLDQLWVYIVFPLVGGIVAWALYKLFAPDEA